MIQLQNLHYVVDIDIKGFFDNINHAKLIRQIWAMGIQDLKVLAIIKAMLKADILFNDIVISPETGTPQGGILSPLLSNIVLNELDWWVASQWETIPTRTNREYSKTDKKGNVVIDRSQKWSMLREKSKLKEIYIVRYADDFKIFCRDYGTAKKTYTAVVKWLKERLSLEISEEKSGITNLKKNYMEFLGIKIRAVSKSGKYAVRSHMTDKAKEKAKKKAAESIKRILNHNVSCTAHDDDYAYADNMYFEFKSNELCYITGLREGTEYTVSVEPILSDDEKDSYTAVSASADGKTETVEVIYEFPYEDGWTNCFAGERASGLTAMPSSGAIYGSKVDTITGTGIRRDDYGDYCCAMGVWYGYCNDRFLIELENGTQFTTKICDSKGYADDGEGKYHNFGGSGKCIVEFIYDDYNLPSCVAFSGSWGYYNWNGLDLGANIKSIKKINYGEPVDY